ncbi:MAG: hypothetical protein KBC56_04930 [Flavobacterium sp.]|nr:hypothetical protein [Flavobacterium sp.]
MSKYEKIKGHSSSLFDNEEWREFDAFVIGSTTQTNEILKAIEEVRDEYSLSKIEGDGDYVKGRNDEMEWVVGLLDELLTKYTPLLTHTKAL